MPFGANSFDRANLAYLTVEQAMMDFVLLVQQIRYTYSPLSPIPVIVFGGSYGGMLASWLRFNYPHVF